MYAVVIFVNSDVADESRAPRKVTLNESQLNKMIMESIKRLLSESDRSKKVRKQPQPKQQVSESRINQIVSETINKVLKDWKQQ